MALAPDALLQRAAEAARACLERMKNETAPTDGEYCNLTFDGIACWGYTPANTTAKQICPDYIMPHKEGMEITEYAYKRCEAGGQWYRQYNTEEGRLTEWSNYTICSEYETPDLVPHMQGPLHDLQIIYTIGYSISLVALIAAMVIFLYFRKLRCPRNTIHMHLFMSFIFRAIFVFIRDKVQSDNEKLRIGEITNGDALDIPSFPEPVTLGGTPGCKAAFTLIQYFLVANFYWLLVEGVYLHSLITLAVFSERSNLIGYLLLGWGCPVLVVLPWTIVQTQQNKEGCWWETVTSDSFYWIIKGPVMLSIVVNFFLFLNILRVLFTKLRASNAAEANQYRKLAKSTLVLIPLFGVYYIISVGMYTSNEEMIVKIRMYFELTMAPIQGFLVALLYCFMNGEVRAEIKRKWRVRQLNRNLSGTRSVRNGHSASFSAGNSCNDIREPLRPAMRRSNSPNSNRTPSNMKERFLALKNNAFGSNNVNGHVQLGNGSAGQRYPMLSQTDVTTTEKEPSPSPSDAHRQIEPEVEAEAVETTPLQAACIETKEDTYSNTVADKSSQITQLKAAPLIRTMDELSRIHDSQAELNTDDVTSPLCSVELQTVDAEPKSLVDSSGASCSVTDINKGSDSPPCYKDLFPDIKSSSSMSNIETQV